MGTTGRFTDLESEAPYPGILRRALHSERMTLTEYTFEPGATFPLHRHAQEQVTLVEDGEVRMATAGATAVLAAGAWSVTPGDVEHGITAGPAGARIVAILSPRRTDSGDITVTSNPEA